MTAASTFRQKMSRVLYFFPFQLLLLQLKRNHVLLLLWAILFAYVTGGLAKRYGIPYLFLYPEYLGKVSFLSYFILGFSCGGFIMSFNIASYIMNGYRFPFIATLARPFIKYCLNNFIIPLAFVLTYVYNIIHFLYYTEFVPPVDIVTYIVWFIFGNLLFIFISYTYFLSTNKNLVKLFGKKADPELQEIAGGRKRKGRGGAVKSMFHKNTSFSSPFHRDAEWRMQTYMHSWFGIRLARDCSHYDRNMLMKVFEQNYINAGIFEVFVILTVVVVGIFGENPVFMIPAGASILLMFTLFVMIFSALNSWIRGWSTTAVVLLVVLYNYSTKYGFFNYMNYAYGLTYDSRKADYSNQRMDDYKNNRKIYHEDFHNGLEILKSWRNKNTRQLHNFTDKPKMVFISTSGGGLRSTLWTFRVMQYADSLLNGKLMRHTQLICGSSGGMIGAAYLRDLYLRKQQNGPVDHYSHHYLTDISADILNPVAFNIAVNDIFPRFRKFDDGGKVYPKDRGYAFERQLNVNTHYFMNKRLGEYKFFEENAIIPMMVFSPTIINDGRMLIVSPLKVSYLTQNIPGQNISHESVMLDGIEFQRFFAHQGSTNLRFTTAMRMSATFPFIMPVTTLPSDPPIEVMDAGIRDNYGMKTILKFIYTFRNWISTNTGGLIIVRIRDKHKIFSVDNTIKESLLESLFTPVQSYYGNFDQIQDYNHDELIQYVSQWYEGNIHIIEFQLYQEPNDRISLSWHLTAKEKNRILQSVYLPDVQTSLNRLKDLITDDK